MLHRSTSASHQVKVGQHSEYQHSGSIALAGESDNIPNLSTGSSIAEIATGHTKLKLLFITPDDPIYVIEFLKVFFSNYPAEDWVLCGITIDRPFHEPIKQTLQRMISFYGYWDTIRQGLRFIRARALGQTIKALALSARVPVITTPSVNNAEYLDRLRVIKPDVIVSISAPEIFSPALLSIPRFGCINIHSGRLPKYRGMMPTFWQMLHGEHAVIISVHSMVEKLDAGDLLATYSFPLKPSDSLDRVIKGTKREGARLLMRVLTDLHKGQLRPIPLDMTQAGYFSFPTPSDVNMFRKQGHQLL